MTHLGNDLTALVGAAERVDDQLAGGAGLSRRRALKVAAAGTGAIVLGGAAGRVLALPTSVIPTETAGPYPADGTNGPNVLTISGVVRSDITSSFGTMSGSVSGVPLTITLKLFDISNGGVLPNYAVYLWHCTPGGAYSLYSSGLTNQNYLRGVQASNSSGEVTFTSVYPGCYSGRWPHIHFEVYDSLASAATTGKSAAKISQMAMPQALSTTVYADSRYGNSTKNLSSLSLATDNVFSDDLGVTQMATVTGDATTGYTAVLEVAINANGAGVVGTTNTTTSTTTSSTTSTTSAPGSSGQTVTPNTVPAKTYAQSAYMALAAPTRILDTRAGQQVGYSGSKPAAGSQTALKIAGVAGVPATGASAVVLNVTAASPEAPGHVTAWPESTRPTASSLNYVAGAARANLVTVPVGSDGNIRLYTLASAHLIADVVGYYGTANTATSGRVRFVTPTRVLDTRSANAVNYSGSRPAAGSTTKVQVLGLASVPTSGVGNVIVNVTAANPSANGYVTVWAGGTQPGTSNVNYLAGQTTANQVISAVASDGTISIKTLVATDLIVDVFGWFTDTSAANGTDGLFVPAAPYRVLDTRSLTTVASGGVVHLNAAATGTAAAGAAGLCTNLTVANTTAAGFVTMWPASDTQPTVSNLNPTGAQQTLANHAIVGVSSAGTVDVYALTALDAIVDVVGWYTGTSSTSSSTGSSSTSSSSTTTTTTR